MPDVLARFQERLRDEGWDAAVVAAAEPLSTVNARYLSGFRGSSCYLVVSPSDAYLLTDSRYIEQAADEAPQFTVLSVTGGSAPRAYAERLAELAADHGWRRLGFEADKVPVATFRQWQEAVTARFEPLAGLVEDLRLVKTADEVARLRQAAHIAGQAVADLLPTLAGRRERDVALELEMAMRRAGAEALAFPTIVVSGARGSLPHGRPTDKVMQDGELVTVDFGARVDGYHSDETITVALGDPPSSLRRLFDVVAEAQAAGIQQVRPGASTADVDAACRTVIARAGYGEFFGHGTGHGVGLAVHENPFVAPAPARAWTLEPGMTLTVEPGIYLPGIGGVRLEDTLVVTEQGHERLTPLPKHWQRY
jgi:Xaa-Pro aminopeptidase